MINVSDANFEQALLAVAADIQTGKKARFDASALTPERKQEFLYALSDFFGGELEGIAHTPQGDIDLAAMLAATKATEEAEALFDGVKETEDYDAEADADEQKIADAFDGGLALILAVEHAKAQAALAAADEHAPVDVAEGVKTGLLLEALVTTAKKSIEQVIKAEEVSKAYAKLRAAKANFKEFTANFNRALDATEAADKLRDIPPAASPIESNAFAPIRGCGAGWTPQGPTGPVGQGGPTGAPIAAPLAGFATFGTEAEANPHATFILENEEACKSVVDKLGDDYDHVEGFAALGRAEDAAANGASETDKTVIRALFHAANNLKLRLTEIEFDTAQEEYGFVLAIDEVTGLIEKLSG